MLPLSHPLLCLAVRVVFLSLTKLLFVLEMPGLVPQMPPGPRPTSERQTRVLLQLDLESGPSDLPSGTLLRFTYGPCA